MKVSEPLRRTLFAILSMLLTLTLGGWVFGIARPENRQWFLLLTGGLALAATILVVGGVRQPFGARLPARLTAWLLLLSVAAFAQLRVWRPQTAMPDAHAVIGDLILPLGVVIALAVGVGACLGALMRSRWR